MAIKRKESKFNSSISQYNNCMCDACFDVNQVIKLEMPITKYHNGKKLTTTYHPYWLCRECRDKLVKALAWGTDDQIDFDYEAED